MIKSWIYLLIIQLCVHDGETQVIPKRLSETLDMDQAYLTVRNTNYSDSILFLFNIVACEHCDLSRFGNPLPINSSQIRIIGTKYPYDFQLFATEQKQTLPCQIESYRFSEHGSYVLEVIQVDQNQSSCSIHQTGDSSYYWTPIIVAVLLLISFVLFVQGYHRFRHSHYVNRLLTNIGHERLINQDLNVTTSPSPLSIRRTPATLDDVASQNDDILGVIAANSELPLVGSTRLSNNSVRITKVLPKRLRALDTLRGFSLMVMIFVNYGGGGYWFFDHSVWNGLTLADLVFPWFVWMMGASVVLSQRSLRAKQVRKRSIFLKICRRTAILFLLGLILQGGNGKPSHLRILGVLQRLALCYFITAVIVLIFEDNDEPHSSQWPIGDDVYQPIRIELWNTVFTFWPQWLCISLMTVAWTVITFVPKLADCPRGYVGPGGNHEHGRYTNCTGGMAGYVDRLILGSSHLYNDPTCRDVYNTQIPYDPEGLLGILTGTLLCYLGVQAGHSFAYSTRVRRVCAQWVISGFICGSVALILSKGGHSESWIPINKNLWSLSFVLVLASLAYFILTILYLLVDVNKWFTGEPWLWLGMNSIVLYVGHDICSGRFPIQFDVDNTHAKQLAMNAYGATLWTLIAGIMYYKKVFIAI